MTEIYLNNAPVGVINTLSLELQTPFRRGFSLPLDKFPSYFSRRLFLNWVTRPNIGTAL